MMVSVRLNHRHGTGGNVLAEHQAKIVSYGCLRSQQSCRTQKWYHAIVAMSLVRCSAMAPFLLGRIQACSQDKSDTCVF